jgi:cytochrome c oxidase subunit IV
MAPHIVPLRVHAGVLAALFVLLAMTVAASHIEHGTLNLVVGLSIAAAKAALILVYFMQLRNDTPVIRLAAGAGFLCLAILMTMVISDYLTRGWISSDRPLGPQNVAGRSESNP